MQAAKKFVARRFPDSELRVGEDPGEPILGATALRAFGEHVFKGKKLGIDSQRDVAVALRSDGITFRPPSRERSEQAELAPPSLAKPFIREHWPDITTALTFTLGKGGVGKTTISGGLAFNRYQHDKRGSVLISRCADSWIL